MTVQKRVFDIMLAVVLLVPLGAVILGLMLVILICEGRPLFYVGERMRTPDQPFRIWKLRTMSPAAPVNCIFAGHNAHLVTRTGHWLRATRLDELPQIWNILRGDMSFVGPRPPLRRYVRQFPALYAQVLHARPGVTGLGTLRMHAAEHALLAGCRDAAGADALYAQVMVPRRARLDLIYQRHRSIRLDLMLIGQTAGWWWKTLAGTVWCAVCPCRQVPEGSVSRHGKNIAFVWSWVQRKGAGNAAGAQGLAHHRDNTQR